MKYDWSEERVRDAVSKSLNYCDSLRALGVPVRGNNIATLKNNIKKYEIDTSHFTGRVYEKGPISRRYKSALEYLKDGTRIQSNKLREKIVAEGIKDYKCDCCGVSEWNGKPITLQLHHIDGDDTNNSIDNIRLLCPNCHSQTVNYRGNKTEKKRYYCPNCGREIVKNSKYCPACAASRRRKIPISDDELMEEFGIVKNRFVLAKKYGVSEAAIRKHLKK